MTHAGLRPKCRFARRFDKGNLADLATFLNGIFAAPQAKCLSKSQVPQKVAGTISLSKGGWWRSGSVGVNGVFSAAFKRSKGA